MKPRNDRERQKLKYHRVLVTGASGFLGQALVPRLVEAGCKATALGMRRSDSPFAPEVDYRCVDLADRSSCLEFLRPWRWDAVVNLAGPLPEKEPSWTDDRRVLGQHVNIAWNLCLGMDDSWEGRFIHASSMTVYGHPERVPVAEDDPRNPTSAYGMAKCLAEDIVLAAAHYKRRDCWVLRLPGLFSESRRSGALYHFIQAAACGRPIVISASEPTPWDVLHRDDAVEAVIRALASKGCNPGPVNISYGSPVELVALAEQIASMGAARVPVQNSCAVRHPVFQMDIGRAQRLLGWPPTSLVSRIQGLWDALAVGFQGEGVTA